MTNPLEEKRCTVYHNTPTVNVYSNQGLSVRCLGYYRREAAEQAAIRIQLQRYDNAGRLSSSIDPRLSISYLKNPAAVIPNQSQQNTLSGNVLQRKNVDSGTRVLFSDIHGQALWSWDSRGTESECDYDALRRIKAVYEKESGKEWVCSERLDYGKVGYPLVGNNAVGRLVEHYDTAGRRVIPAYTLLGQAQAEIRSFIKADEVLNWVPEAVENQKRLEEQPYHSVWTYNRLGEVLRQSDARGNERETAYDVAGQMRETLLQLKEGKKQSLSEKCVYNASGQLQEECLGNGVSIRYRYEPKTQRLYEKEAIRLSDMMLLQSLQYTYDPVGNILTIEDKAKADETDHYKNTKTEAISRYTYDSYYQLTVAEGIESEQASQPGKLPNAIVFGNKDASRLINYQRTYHYDEGGNLLEIRQQGSNPVMKLTLDTQSNRGIEKRASGPSLHESFDSSGNLLYINTGQPLRWNIRNQLQESIQVEREDTLSDKETYLYDGQGSRIQKTRVYLMENQLHTERVRYLAGLELRERWQTDRAGENQQDKECLFLIQAQAAGKAPVKALHWEIGQPSEIENDGLYYTLTDQIGSSQIELDNVGELINYEAYYPYGGTAIWATKNQVASNYKYRCYSGKERDHSGLYYYGYRYYLPWLGRWLNADPSGISQGLNLFEMANNNPITFHDEDGRKPTFSELYPNTEEDELTGETYHPIQKIFSTSAHPALQDVRVNLKAYELALEDNERAAYLFTGPEYAERLLIYAHGGFYPEDIINLTPEIPSVTFVGPHDQGILGGPSLIDMNQSYVNLSYEAITLTSEQAEQDFLENYEKITGTATKQAISNYYLTKFPTDISEDPKLAPYGEHFLDVLLNQVELSRKQNKPLDILTIRKERGEMVSVRDIFSLAEKRGYEEVICYFCRSSMEVDRDSVEQFSVKEIKKLNLPIRKIWAEIGNT